MGLKRCLKCHSILSTENYMKGYNYCYDCYTNKLSFHNNSGLAKCLVCNGILKTEEYQIGLTAHRECKSDDERDKPKKALKVVDETKCKICKKALSKKEINQGLKDHIGCKISKKNKKR